MSFFPIILIFLLACWGSFLNSLAYRLIYTDSFSKCRSFCPSCRNEIFWYDLIPILSWCLLHGRCRNCHQPISKLYPLIEFLTIIVGLGLVYTCLPETIFAYSIFCSALIITIRTDLQTMLISRFTTIFLIPVAWILSLLHWGSYFLLPISIVSSIKGALFGYLILYLTNKFFWLFTKKQGMGEGDIELLAMIGSFIGVTGAWVTLMLGSILGSLVGIVLIYCTTHQSDSKIPFGPFLAISAIIYILCQNQILKFLFYW